MGLSQQEQGRLVCWMSHDTVTGRPPGWTESRVSFLQPRPLSPEVV